jgi:hypothetical protein
MQITKKRGAAVGAAAALCLIAGTSAFAYWTTTGSGSGSAATGTTSPVTITTTSAAITGLYPGGPAVPLAGKFNNPNPGAVYVNQVTVGVSSISTPQANGSLPACTAADFTLVQPGATAAEIAAGNAVGSWTGASIAMKDTAANQDNCKSVTVNLSYTSN